MGCPLVSVFLSSYNHEKYVGEAIESVLNQSFKDFELIISDDCSSDNSWSVINSYTDNRIVKIRNSCNQGANLTMEKIKSFKGKYVAIHHSDDVWKINKLEKQVEFLENHPEYGACFTMVEYVDENGNFYDLPDKHVYKGIFDVKNRSRYEWLNHFFFCGNCLCHPSVLIRKELYFKYNLLENRIGMRQLPDFIIWVRLCMHENIYVYPETLTKFRLRRKVQENTSADRPDTHIRSQYEYYKVMSVYAEICDSKQFLAVFPEAQKYVVDGEINIKFALANMLLEGGAYSGWLLGLDLIFKELNQDSSRNQLLRLYNFDVKAFGKLVADKDVFNVSRNFRYLNSQLFIDIGDGNGIDGKNVINQKIYLGGDNHFYASFDISGYETVQALRFDPTDTYISLKIDKVKIDGVDAGWEPCNICRHDDDKDVFYTKDPQYSISARLGTWHTVEIMGQVYESGECIIDKAYQKLNQAYQELNQVYQDLNQELISIKHSRGYRLLENLRNIKRRYFGWI